MARAYTACPEDLTLLSDTHIRWLTSTYSTRSITLASNLRGHLDSRAHTHTETYTVAYGRAALHSMYQQHLDLSHSYSLKVIVKALYSGWTRR